MERYIELKSQIILSIVVIVYNTEEFLEKCLESIVKQNLENSKYEVIIVNDGSTDRSEEICLKYLNKNQDIFKYFFLNNKGCGNARNFGIQKSKGKYIAFVDSDDYVEENMYLEMLNLIEKEKNDLVVCGIKEVYINNKIKKNLPGEINNKNDFFKKNGIFNSPTNKIYKLTIIKERKIKFLTNSHMGEDMLFNYIYYKNVENVSSINKLFYNYVKHEKGVTNNLSKRKEIFISFKAFFEYLNNKKDIKEFNKLFKIHAISNSYGVLEKNIFNKQEFKIEKEDIEKRIKEFEKILNLETKIHWVYRKIRLKIIKGF